ncbi:unnamed protein product [Blepharisma stoltei]|uniref:Reverse transcriptase domain-containing protein n=1 Tax=Blepharisma stoltei TaxID=1481888 RepID=A0AAU9JJV0_9CILI|nr:unnamed protein product [Blepharisma stoltei]
MNAFEIKEFEDQFRSTISFIPQAGCLEDELWNSKKIENIIKSLPNRKAPGPDNITNEIIIKGGDIMVEAITHFLNTCRIYGIPDVANEAKTILIYKGKGNHKELKNLRPITLMNSFMKILDKAELRKIENNVKISDRQHGFRKGKSCITQSFLLKNTLEYRKYYNKGKKSDSYILFIDFSKAYDSVNRTKLMEKIKSKRVTDDSGKSISQMIKGEKTTLIINGNETFKIDITKGIRQGSAISPLFNIYIDDIENVTKDISLELIKNENLYSKINFQYADDTAFITGKCEDLQSILNNLKKWTEKIVWI